jgi:hypothetical protein
MTILKKKEEIFFSIPVNFSNDDPSYKTRSTIHEKIIRVKITQKIQNKK